MAYDPTSDFLALVRQTSGGTRIASVPGLDFVIAALARAGQFALWVNPTNPPAVNQASTVWLKTSSQDWAGEGSVFLYNPTSGNFEPATPELWQLLFGALNAATFQSVSVAAANVNAGTTLLAVRRDNPGVTLLSLPSVNVRTQDLKAADWSTNVAMHEIRFTPFGGETIMRRATFSMFSTPDQLAGVTLTPSIDLQGWVITP